MLQGLCSTVGARLLLSGSCWVSRSSSYIGRKWHAALCAAMLAPGESSCLLWLVIGALVLWRCVALMLWCCVLWRCSALANNDQTHQHDPPRSLAL